MANFQVNSIPSWVQYTATNGQTEFSMPFPFIDNADIYVWQNEVRLTLTTDYTLTGSNTASGGQVTLNIGASLNDRITIQDLMTIDRTNIYTPVISALTGSALNNDFNRDVIMIRDTTTTANYLMLQYAPYANISQDIAVTNDRLIPILGALQAWRKDATNTFIEAFNIPSIPIGIQGAFTADNRLVSTDLGAGTNYVQQTDIQAVGDVITSISGSLTLTGTNNVNLTTTGSVNLVPSAGLYLSGTKWPTTPGAELQVPRFKAGSSTEMEWVDILSVTLPVLNNHIARFDGTTGSIKESIPAIDDSGNITGALSVAGGNLLMSANTLSSVTGDITLNALTGNVLLTQDPTLALAAATKQYVDSKIAGAPGGLAGAIQFNNSGSFGGDTVTTNGTGTWTGNVTLVGTFQAGNVKLNTNTISSTNTDGNINLTPNGVGINVLANAQVTSLTASKVTITDGSKNLASSTVASADLPYMQTQDGAKTYAADTGAADAYVITLSPVPASYTTGMVLNFKATNANTTTSTLNVNSLGAKTIKKNASSNLIAGDISAGQMVSVVYDGTNFQMQSQLTNTTDGGGVNAGLINQLGYYAASGNIISGLTTANSSVLVTNGSGVPSLSTTLPSGIAATNMNLTTPTLGVASATSINKVAITAPATSATLTIADGKTLTASNTLTFTGTDGSSVAFGTGGTVLYNTVGISRVVQQNFPSSGTYTPTSGMKYCIVYATGGGGGGGGTPTSGAGSGAASGGGGSGAYSIGVYSAADIGASKTVTIGAAGTGVSNGTGNNGGQTSLSTLLTAPGGSGAIAKISQNISNSGIPGNGGAAGTGTGSILNYPGSPGCVGICFIGGTAIGGAGGNGPHGSGGSPPSTSSGSAAGGSATGGTGAGGSGAVIIAVTGSNQAGGDGGSGYISIVEFCSN